MALDRLRHDSTVAVASPLYSRACGRVQGVTVPGKHSVRVKPRSRVRVGATTAVRLFGSVGAHPRKSWTRKIYVVTNIKLNRARMAENFTRDSVSLNKVKILSARLWRRSIQKTYRFDRG